MSRYFDRLAQRSGLSPRGGAGAHRVTTAASAYANERGDVQRAQSLEVHAENVIDNNAEAAPSGSDIKQRPRMEHDSTTSNQVTRLNTDSTALTQITIPESGATARNRPVPAAPAPPPRRTSPQSAARVQSNNAPPDVSAETVAAPAQAFNTNIETPAISSPGPEDIARTQFTEAEPGQAAQMADTSRRTISARAAESSHSGRRDSQPFAEQQAVVQSGSRNDGATVSDRSAVTKADFHDRGQAVPAARVRTSVAGDAIHKAEANRSSRAGNIKISIGKIDLQVNQQADRPALVPNPVKTRERPSKPGNNNNGATGHGDMNRYYFRWY